MNNKSQISYFRGSIGGFFGGVFLGYLAGGWSGMYFVALLSVLEVSLSLDNAVVNSKILEHWNDKWRHAFLWYGLPIAVFGMRLIFPILIVTVTTGLGSIEVIHMVINRPDEYARALTSAHHQVAAFGGAFLMMVFFKFFVDKNKDEHWFHRIEAPLTRLGQIEAIEVAFTLIALFGASVLIDESRKLEFLVAGGCGLVLYVFTKGLGSMLGDEDDEDNEAASHIVKQTIYGFLYLEMLDASFSFDGVIGAFALSSNPIIIFLGLGVGALFVRSLTIYLVENESLKSLRYVEHGAFWAIGTLSIIMLFGVTIHIPEAVTGFIGAVLIGLSIWHSVLANRKDDEEERLAKLKMQNN